MSIGVSSIPLSDTDTPNLSLRQFTPLSSSLSFCGLLAKISKVCSTSARSGKIGLGKAYVIYHYFHFAIIFFIMIISSSQ
jgi:hypothetical protein